jgi:hypothetical protein
MALQTVYRQAYLCIYSLGSFLRLLLEERMFDFQSIQQILFAYHRLTTQYEATLDRDLEALYEQTVTSVINLRRHEDLWLAARSNWVERLRPLLETDARCLLSTSQFTAYVQPLLFLNRATSQTQSLAVNPSAWVLKQIKHPLFLGEYEAVYRNDTYSYLLTARLGTWQQRIQVSVVSFYSSSSEFFEAIEQWEEALKQIHASFDDFDLGESQKALLPQEISCLICYVGQLFELRPKTAWFRYP